MEESKLYMTLRPIGWLLCKIVFHPKIVGRKNIPKEGRLVLAGNHTSVWDWLLLVAALKRPIHFLAKAELFKGFKKFILVKLGIIPVNRNVRGNGSLERAIEYLDSDMVVGIFPEGTISKNNKMLSFKKGAVKMAYRANSKVVPFKISGKYGLFSNNLKIEFGKAYNVISDNYEEEIAKLYSIIDEM